MHRVPRSSGLSPLSRRHFIRKAAGAGAVAAATTSILSGEEPAQAQRRTSGPAPAADTAAAASPSNAIRIPEEITAGSNAAPTEIQFPMTGAKVFARACKDEGVAALFCCPGNYGVIHAIAGVGIPAYSSKMALFQEDTEAGIQLACFEGIRDQGSGIRDQGSGIRDQGSGIRDQGSGIRDQGSGIRDQGSGIRDQGSGIRDQGSGIRD